MLKQYWGFYCVNGKSGSMILPYPVSAEEALKECRLSLGPKVMRVY